MTAKRDSLFPSASVGRAHGVHIARTPSRESLVVHPLLNTPDSAKYIPYTPRQRQPAAATPVQPSTPPPPPSQGSKPQLANLRAAALTIGLDTNSIGWAVLEKISYEGDTSDEWSEIWNALTKARATLLLPSLPSSGHDTITPELVQDHLVFCDLASKDNTAVVTFSGLRGQLVNGSITFRSTLHRSAKAFQALLMPSASRAASLDALPPLPAYPLESSYPSFTVSAFNATLPLPARATKPPLPPRPGIRGAPVSSSARLSLPFASLFGQRPSTPPPSLPTVATASAPAPPSMDADTTIDISAFVIDTVLSRADIATGIISALKGEIAIALNDQPPWLVERVHTFALPYFPFVKLPAGKKKLQDIGSNPNRVVYAVNGVLHKPDELADKFQAFYTAMEAELRNGSRVQVEGDGPDMSDSQGLGPAEDKEEEADDAQIREVLEMIEATLCTLLYDRLFLLSTSDDASHNEALSSRIAALNMLDLGLEHLDIDIGDANRSEVDAVVCTCGQTLAQLDLSARSPREKGAVLVSAHKLVVEGLSKIPPIRLKGRDDTNEVPTSHVSGPTEAAEYTSAVSAVTVPSPAEKSSASMLTVHLSTSHGSSSVIEQDTPSSPSSLVSGDVLLPILIFSVVKANPSRLVSHLLFTQRFRNQTFGGEESYCLINLMAVAEFLENVDLGVLGLGESEEKVLSTADLTPIPVARPKPGSPIATTAPLGEEHLASLRGRVGQGVDAIAGSANKVILGVVDTSFGVLRVFLPGQTAGTSGASGPVVVSGSGTESGIGLGPASGSGTGAVPALTSTSTGESDAAVWSVRPSLGLLRRETGFSIAGLTVALPGGVGPGKGRGHSQSHPEEEGQRELVEVSLRSPSLRSHRSGQEGERSEDGDKGEDAEGEESEEGSEDNESSGEAGRETEEGEDEAGEECEERVHDTRSIKSFESMLSSGRKKRGKTHSVVSSAPGSESVPTMATRRRKRLTDLTDRLTHGVVGVSRRAQSGNGQNLKAMVFGRLQPPNRRFMECTEQDIRVSEVGDLLREYQRLVEAVRDVGGFRE